MFGFYGKNVHAIQLLMYSRIRSAGVRVATVLMLVVLLHCYGCTDVNYPTDVLDKSPYDMSGGSFVIDGDAPFAYSQQVMLSSHVDNAYWMQFSNDAIRWVDWVAFDNHSMWLLPLQYGETTVYAHYKNIRGDIVAYQDSIFFVERLVNNTSIQLGGDVAVSNDGAIVAAGTLYGRANAVYVFHKQSIDWQGTKIKPDDIVDGDRFGYCVALSGDGRWLFAGAPGKNAVYVYEYTDAWQVRQVIERPFSLFGYDIATDDSGEYVAVTVYDGQRVEVYRRNGSNGYGLASVIDVAGYKPYSVTLTGDAGFLFVGWGAINDAGMVKAYQRAGSSFSGVGDILPGDGQHYAFFGQSVAVTDDACWCVIGSPGYDILPNDDKGCFYIFKRNADNTFLLLTQIKNTGGSRGDALGGAVAMSRDGRTIVASMHLYDTGLNAVDRGLVQVYSFDGSGVEHSDTYSPDDRDTTCYFGNAIAASNNGVIVIGAPYAYRDTAGDNGGVVYIRRWL